MRQSAEWLRWPGHGGDTMKMPVIARLSVMPLACLAAAAAMAQSAPPTYQADPDVYKVIFENQSFRVIAAMHRKGARDKLHTHTVPSITYYLTDCTTKHYFADGTTREDTQKAGTVYPISSAVPHFAENTGAADCQQIFVERK
jgi:hypothetical protein